MKLCLILCGFVLLDAVCSSSIMKLELKKVQNNARKRWLDYKAKVPAEDIETRQLIDSITERQISEDSLVNINDMYFTSVIYVGGQYFVVQVDTGSADLWIPSINCQTSDCVISNRYNSSASTTYQAVGTPITLSYGTGSLTGVVQGEAVQMGGWTETPFYFVEALNVPSAWSSFNFDGILGFSLPTPAGANTGSTGQTPFWLVLAQGGAIPAPVFSMYLNVNETSTTTGGALVLGGIDPQYSAVSVSQIIYSPLLTDTSYNPFGFWMFNMTSIKTSASPTTSFCSGMSCLALVDSGTSLIGGPATQIAAINKAIGATTLKSNGLYYFPSCTYSKVVVYIYIGNQKLPIYPFFYTYVDSSYKPAKCYSAFFSDGGTNWILGDTFMSAYYTVFDYGNQQIGFLPAANNAKREMEEQEMSMKAILDEMKAEKGMKIEDVAEPSMFKNKKPHHPAAPAARRALEELLDELENNK